LHAEVFLTAEKIKLMERSEERQARKAGRPKKQLPLSEQLAVMCTKTDRAVIQAKAKQSGRCVSAYLRELGLSGKVEIKMQTIPKEILLLKGMLSHAAANLNQIAKKKNSDEPFNALDRAEASLVLQQTKELIKQIEQFFR